MVLFTIKPPVITMSIMQPEKKKKLFLSSTPTGTCGQVNICKQAGLLLGCMTMPLPFPVPRENRACFCLRVWHFFQTPAHDLGCIPCLQGCPEPGDPLGCSTCLQFMSCSVSLWHYSECLDGSNGVFGQRSCSSAGVLHGLAWCRRNFTASRRGQELSCT